MKTFRIREKGFKEIRKQILKWTIPVLLFSSGVGVCIVEFGNSKTGNSNSYELPLVILIIAGVLIYATNKAIKSQKVIYESYLLKILENGIVREQANTPAITISFSEIKSITKTNQGGLVIKGSILSDMILVPAQLDDMEGFTKTLQSNAGVVISESKPLIQRFIIPLVLLVLVLMATVYISTNRILVLISGLLLLPIIILSFIKLRTNKNIDNKTRRSSYWLILVFLSIIGIIVKKILG
jgi:hypothetical protein